MKALLLAAALAVPAHAAPAVRVMASSTDLAWLAREVGAGRVDAFAPLPGTQEPELWVDDVFPSWLVRAARADLYIRIGMSADVWAESVVDGSRNPRIAPGSPGDCDASAGAAHIEVPDNPDRSRGEIHLGGNPHYLLDPVQAKQVADVVAACLARVDPAGADAYGKAAAALKARLAEAQVRWDAKAAPLKGRKFAAYHRTWSHSAARFGYSVVGYVEPKPGVEPSPRDLAALEETLRRDGVGAILMEPVHPRRVAEAVARRTGAKVFVLPAHVGGAPGTDDYFAFVDVVLDRLLEAASASRL